MIVFEITQLNLFYVALAVIVLIAAIVAIILARTHLKSRSTSSQTGKGDEAEPMAVSTQPTPQPPKEADRRSSTGAQTTVASIPAPTAEVIDFYSAWRTQIRDLQSQLRQNAQAFNLLKEGQTQMRNELEKVQKETQTLLERLGAKDDEVQRMKATLENLGPGKRDESPLPVESRAAEPTTKPTTAEQAAGRFSRMLKSVFTPPISCSNCGRRLRVEDRFCDSCGRPIIQTGRKPT